jgi:hypothetical protein
MRAMNVLHMRLIGVSPASEIVTSMQSLLSAISTVSIMPDALRAFSAAV